MRTRSALLIGLFAAACSSSSPAPGNRTPTAQTPTVNVELSGVTLAEDCGSGAVPQRVMTAAVEGKEARESAKTRSNAEAKRDIEAESQARGACADPSNCHGPSRRCTPTSMQLSVRAPSDAAATTIRIVKVELLDPSGKSVLDTLTARQPSRWDGDGAYTGWNEKVAPGQSVAASYLLSTPNWDKLAGGRWNAHTKVFQLRVTVSVGDAERTIEKQSIVPAAIAPEVET